MDEAGLEADTQVSGFGRKLGRRMLVKDLGCVGFRVHVGTWLCSSGAPEKGQG